MNQDTEMKQDGLVLYHHPNTLPPPQEIFAFDSRDPEGKEAICGFESDWGMTAMVTCDKKLLEMVYAPQARRLKALEGTTGKTIHLLRFTSREEISWSQVEVMEYRQPSDREKFLMEIGGFKSLQAMVDHMNNSPSPEEEEQLELPSEGVQELEDPEDEEEPSQSA
jgi:hypothetical protein